MFKQLAFVLLACLTGTCVAEQTLSIIKPNAIYDENAGQIIAQIQENGFKIIGLKMVKLDKQQAAEFYKEHQGKPFFNELLEFMSSGPIIVQVLDGEGAISAYRDLMGNVDPLQAGPGTLRSLYGESKGRNAVHGSDSPASAKREIAFFFKNNEIFPR